MFLPSEPEVPEALGDVQLQWGYDHLRGFRRHTVVTAHADVMTRRTDWGSWRSAACSDQQHDG
jgi:hypothetical protein